MQDTSTIKSNSIITRSCYKELVIAITSQKGPTAVRHCLARRCLEHFAFCSFEAVIWKHKYFIYICHHE